MSVGSYQKPCSPLAKSTAGENGSPKNRLREVERVSGYICGCLVGRRAASGGVQYPSPCMMWIEPVPDAVMYATVFWSCALDRVICVLGSTG